MVSANAAAAAAASRMETFSELGTDLDIVFLRSEAALMAISLVFTRATNQKTGSFLRIQREQPNVGTVGPSQPHRILRAQVGLHLVEPGSHGSGILHEVLRRAGGKQSVPARRGVS